MWRLASERASCVLAETAMSDIADTAPTRCFQLPGGDDEDAAERARLDASREAFWQAREEEQCWVVPLGRDLATMPWLSHRSVGVLEAMQRARLHGRTPLLVDNTAHRAVDTFFAYRAVQVLELKEMVVDEHTGRRSHAEVMENARQRLVNAMRYGQTLYVRLSNTVPALRTRYTAADTLPLAILDHAVVAALLPFTGIVADNLADSEHPLARVLREADTEHGHFSVRPGFDVVVSTHLAAEGVAEALASALPMELLQPISPQVTARESQQASNGGADALEDAGPQGCASGELGGGELGDDRTGEAAARELTLADAREAAARLARRVEAMRARRGA